MIEWTNVDDFLPKIKSGDNGVQVIALCDYGDGEFYDVVHYWSSRGFDQHPVKFWAYINHPTVE